MKSVRGFGIILFTFAFAFMLISCQQNQGDNFSVSDSWSRPSNAGNNGAIYFVINNPTQKDDSLIKVESDVAETAELHKSSMDANGNMSMEPQDRVSIPAGEKVEFKPGGFHVMLIKLKNDLKAGEKFNATLTFEKTGKMNIEVIVREP